MDSLHGYCCNPSQRTDNQLVYLYILVVRESKTSKTYNMTIFK
jgi:hypothetical protein